MQKKFMVVHMNNYKSFIVIVVLAILYFLINLITSPKIITNKKFNDIFDFKTLKQIEIKKISLDIGIEKKEDGYYLTRPYLIKANDDEINRFIEKLSNSKLYGPLTTKKELYPKFEINFDTSTVIELTGKDKIKLLLGKATIDLNGMFINIQDNGIYEFKNLSVYDVNKDLSDLIDRKPISIKKEDIEKIEIEYNNKKYTFARLDDKWNEKDEKIVKLIDEIRNGSIKEAKNEKPDLIINIISLSKTQKLNIKKEKDRYSIIYDNFKIELDIPNSEKIAQIIKLL